MTPISLTEFFVVIKDDNRIATAHISVYVVLFERYCRNGFVNPIAIRRREIMEAAKISGIATYHRCMKDLDELKYIKYLPSHNPEVWSKVEMLELCSE